MGKVYWLARVARSAPGAPVGGLASGLRAHDHDRVASANYAAARGRAAGVGPGALCAKYVSTQEAGDLPPWARPWNLQRGSDTGWGPHAPAAGAKRATRASQ